MVFPNIQQTIRPNRLTENKDEKYHIEYARYVLSCCNDTKLWLNLWKYMVNYNFYNNNQWIFENDIKNFLEDEYGSLNREKWELNLIKGPVMKYVGQALKTQWSARAYNVNPQSNVRKTKALAKKMVMFYIAQQMPKLKDILTAKYGLGQTPEETEAKFNEEWVDYSPIAINALIREQEQRNKFDFLNQTTSMNKALGGIAIVKNWFQGQSQQWKSIDPAYFFYDTTGVMPDLSDAQFMGEIHLNSPVDIYEQKPGLSNDIKKRIEEATKSDTVQSNYIQSFVNSFGYVTKGRMPSYEVYWHDTEMGTYGYVMTEDGFLKQAKIEQRDTRSDVQKGSEYDNKQTYYVDQVIPRSQLPESKRKFVDEQGLIKKSCDVIRYCEIIPSECLSGSGFSYKDGENIALDYGMLEYQDSYHDEPFDSSMPYKVSIYDYHFGEVLTPLDSLIKPQRLLNRIASVQEGLVARMAPDTYVYDKNFTEGESGGEAKFRKNMQRGIPTAVDAIRSGGVQNGLLSVSNQPKTNSAGGLMNVMQMLKDASIASMGMNDSMLGTGDGAKTLVGVQQNNIMAGNIMQEMFYSGLERMWKDVYMCIANRGRRFYADNEIKLYQISGPTDMDYIQFTKNMKTDHMQIELRRTNTGEQAMQDNNLKLMQLFQLGIIGIKQFGDLYGNAETDQVAYAIQEYSKEYTANQQAAAQQANEAHDKELQTKLQIAALPVQDKEKARQWQSEENNKQLQSKQNREIYMGTNKIMLEKMRKLLDSQKMTK